jgi:aminomethyltransferase
MPEPVSLRRTPLHDLHQRLGARMVAFAGYSMPVQYGRGLIAEHRQCREAAALFDVSHMGQVSLVGADAARALETLVPVDVVDLAVGRQRYAFFTNAQGGMLDDLMIARPAPEAGLGDLLLVVNAGCKDDDLRHLQTHIGHRCGVRAHPERALLALQGPLAVAALARLNPAISSLPFMGGTALDLAGHACFVTRSGYTGEDGFEISVPRVAGGVAGRAAARAARGGAGRAGGKRHPAPGSRPVPVRP